MTVAIVDAVGLGTSYQQPSPVTLAGKGMGVSPLSPCLLQVHGSTVMPQVRHRCLAALVKMLYFSTSETLEGLLADQPISSFIASLLASRDARSVAYALQLAELLMQQLPDIFRTHFVREGVAHALGELSTQTLGSARTSEVGGAAQPTAQPADPTPAMRVTRFRSAQQQQAQQAPQQQQAAAGSDAAAAGAQRASRTASLTLREAVVMRAERFRAQHFSANATGALETDSLKLLRQLGSGLEKDPAGSLSALFQVGLWEGSHHARWTGCPSVPSPLGCLRLCSCVRSFVMVARVQRGMVETSTPWACEEEYMAPASYAVGAMKSA